MRMGVPVQNPYLSDRCSCRTVLLRDVQAIVQLSLGQASGSQEQMKAAQQFFQVVGSSPSECDTIPGRQAMASCFFMLQQYEDVLVFLSVSTRAVCMRKACMVAFAAWASQAPKTITVRQLAALHTTAVAMHVSARCTTCAAARRGAFSTVMTTSEMVYHQGSQPEQPTCNCTCLVHAWLEKLCVMLCLRLRSPSAATSQAMMTSTGTMASHWQPPASTGMRKRRWQLCSGTATGQH